VLNLGIASASVHATLTVTDGSPIDLGTVVPTGNALELDAGPYTAKIYLMAETRDAIAGFVRNEQGIPNGIFGTKRPLVAHLPPDGVGQVSAL
jgi:predicted hotdog family 3-hydroxylacyl-ACP dehydratase